MEIKDGDYFLWDFKDVPQGANYSLLYWCKDQKCFARYYEYEDKILLYDTYWVGPFDNFHTGDPYIVDPDRVVLHYVCNINDIRLIQKWDIEDYDEVYNLSRQNGCYKQYAVSKNAEKSNKAILLKLQKQLERALQEKRSAQYNIESVKNQITEHLDNMTNEELYNCQKIIGQINDVKENL